MMTCRAMAVVTASFLTLQCTLLPAYADNQMGYRLLSPQQATALPHNHGSLGLNVERVQQMTSGGMTFDIIGITQVRRASAGAQAGFRPGDEIIAIDGQVFPSLATFAAYVGSIPPGRQITVDYMPAGTGPQKAQRAAVVVGSTTQASQASPSDGQSDSLPPAGMSTGTKVAVALLGCYEMGCFSHRSSNATLNTGRQQIQQQPNKP
jgi:membrane-associated protease RseP (regulator of RpoE activity)